MSNGVPFEYAHRAHDLQFAKSPEHRTALEEQRDMTLEDYLSTLASNVASNTADIASNTADIASHEAHLDGLPTMVQSGASAATSASGGVCTFVFPTAFASAPVVVVTGTTPDSINLYVSARSSTGFTMINPSLAAGFTRTYLWIAVGVAP